MTPIIPFVQVFIDVEKFTKKNMKKTTTCGLLVAAFAMATPMVYAVPAQGSKPANVASGPSAKQVSKILKAVSKKVAAQPANAGAIVRSAILANRADSALTALIVEAAIKAAPAQIASITASALSAAPGAKAAIIAVAAKYNYKGNGVGVVAAEDGTVAPGGTLNAPGGGQPGTGNSALSGAPVGVTNGAQTMPTPPAS